VRLIDRVAALHPGASRSAIRRWLAGGRVRLNDAVVRRADAPVGAGDRVALGPAAPVFPGRLGLVHEDSDLLVVDKPPGLLTIATERERERTAYRLLADYVAGQAGAGAPGARRPRLFIVHRLDRETSGLLVFAKSPATKAWLQRQFAARAVERVYAAVVEGRVPADAGTLRGRLAENRALRVRPTRDRRAGREAITHYRVLERRGSSTRLEVVLETGRRGQIRAQLAALGHPIVGDRAYGARRDPLGRLCLHAVRLGFRDPAGRWRRFESPPPAAFARA
jgi:23S rRNA pseudouridine1911/1915/1917 synthase